VSWLFACLTRVCVRGRAQRINVCGYARDAYTCMCPPHARTRSRVRKRFCTSARARAPVRACAHSAATGDTPPCVQRLRRWQGAPRHGRARSRTHVRALAGRTRACEAAIQNGRHPWPATSKAQRAAHSAADSAHVLWARDTRTEPSRAHANGRVHTCCRFGRVRVLLATGPALARRHNKHHRCRHCRRCRCLGAARSVLTGSLRELNSTQNSRTKLW